jgi:histidine triad (HIT) family protein
MQDSIFTKIIKGEIPCHKIYEDAKTFAFLDIHPLLPGHVLVVPKAQVDHFDDLAEEDYQALFATVRKVAKRAKTGMGTERAIIQVMGFDVPHTHVHVMPANSSLQYFQAASDHLNKDPYPYQPTQDELVEIAARLRLPDEL